MPTLTLQLPGLPPVAHVLREETTTIGRMKGSTIVVDDASVSLMHAKITRKDGEFFLKDLNSTNGTLVNGQPVREAKLQDFDQICFADVIGQFHDEAATAVPPPAAPLVNSLPGKSQPSPDVPVKQRRDRHANSKFDLTRLAERAVPILVGIAALFVVSLLVWKIVFSDRRPRDNAETFEPVPQADKKQANTDHRKEPVASPTPSIPNLAIQNTVTARIENETVARWVAGLKDSDAAERRRAVRSLHSMGTEAKEAVAALRLALADKDQDVQMWAALALVNNKSYDRTTIPILVRGLHHENPVLRQIACLSLGVIPYEESEKETVVPPLAERAGKDSDEDVRKAAVSALNIIAPEVLVRAVEK